jgi:5'-nucleotidase
MDMDTGAGTRKARIGGRAVRSTTRLGVLLALVAVLASGCFYLPYQQRGETDSPGVSPWWCTSNVGADLSVSDCEHLSTQLDAAHQFIDAHPTAASALSAGATASPYVAGDGAAFTFTGPTSTFQPAHPDTLLYTSTDPSAQVAGAEWNVQGATAPAGFAGDNDVWTESSPGVWTLHVWIVRPFENEPDVFAATQPCLAGGGAILDTTDTCYTSTHTHTLEIVVTNDDGYNAPGIDAVVQALITVPGVHVDVVAPATNQSGTGNKTTSGTLTASSGTTLSGYPATAVNGYPADTINYALNYLDLNPDLVISGINDGQNIGGPIVNASGTVGAARAAGANAIPALAASQEDDNSAGAAFPVGAAAVLSWLNQFELGQAGPPFQVVANLNVPSCDVGSVRGTLVLPASGKLNGRGIGPTNCTSTVTTFNDDLDGFLNGYITVSDIGLGS